MTCLWGFWFENQSFKGLQSSKALIGLPKWFPATHWEVLLLVEGSLSSPPWWPPHRAAWMSSWHQRSACPRISDPRDIKVEAWVSFMAWFFTSAVFYLLFMQASSGRRLHKSLKMSLQPCWKLATASCKASVRTCCWVIHAYF